MSRKRAGATAVGSAPAGVALPALLFASGFAGRVYPVLWMRELAPIG